MAKEAINGLGRIGRAAFKLIIDNPELELIAINDIVSPENLAYLLKYDTVYGRYEKMVESDSDSLVVDGNKYKVLNEKAVAQLPWSNLGIDIVFECTGTINKKGDLEK